MDPTTPGVELTHVANQSVVLDLVDDPNQPLANVTLQASIATLSYALEHLPDLAKTFEAGHAELMGAPGRFRIRLEMDEALALDAMSGAVPIGPGDVDPMELDGITVVDDGTFIQHLKSNVNLPQWLKSALWCRLWPVLMVLESEEEDLRLSVSEHRLSEIYPTWPTASSLRQGTSPAALSNGGRQCHRRRIRTHDSNP